MSVKVAFRFHTPKDAVQFGDLQPVIIFNVFSSLFEQSPHFGGGFLLLKNIGYDKM